MHIGSTINNPTLPDSDINGNYVDGVSLTHGAPMRQHIWTFAAAEGENVNHPGSNCPCTNRNNPVTSYTLHLVL